MSDMAGHGGTQHDEVRHTLTVRDVEILFAKAGIHRSHRHVLRLCQSGMLDAVKVPGGPSGDEWYVAPASVPKAIGDLKQIEERRTRRSATQQATSLPVAAEIPHDVEQDTPRHSVLQPDVSPEEISDKGSETQPAAPRHDARDLDIYEHPYVKRLENEVAKWEGRYEAQVRRTEDIQLKAQERLVELQRMTTIGQSKTLADFMLQAKNWIVGADEITPPSEEGKSSA